jgi:transcriptional regulator with XRE-family HTH domain
VVLQASYHDHGGVPNLTRKRQHKVLVALGRAIREARQARGLSQEALALSAEVDRAHVGRVERGDSNAAVLTIAQIAKALNLPVSKLLQRAGL